MTWRRKIPGEGACGPCCSWKERFDQLWDRAIGCITKINNITPDGDGKFEIRGGPGVQVTPISNGVEIINTGAVPQDAIETINSINPDADKNFEITAGTNISIDDDENGITINCDVPPVELSAVSPIEITQDGDIALKGWTEDTGSDWSVYVTNDTVNTDLIVFCKNDPYYKGFQFIPKGTPLMASSQYTQYNWANGIVFTHITNWTETLTITFYALLRDHAVTTTVYRYANQIRCTTTPYISGAIIMGSINTERIDVSRAGGNDSTYIPLNNIKLYHR